MTTTTKTTTQSNAVTISTRKYYREHWKNPRGRGSWAFCPVEKYDASDYIAHTKFSPGGMTFTEAKRWAKANFPAGTCLETCT
jgi:hypothetical protein